MSHRPTSTHPWKSFTGPPARSKPRESPPRPSRKTCPPLREQTALALFSNAPGAAVLVNYATLTEGTDLPRIDCVIIGRHTDSENTIIQMIGRGLRKHPDKRDCLVLDYTGRPDMDDIIHYWRLDGLKESRNRAKRKRAPGLSRDELMELATEFPNQLSPMDTTRTRYPWFSPFPGRPLLALALWSGAGQSGRLRDRGTRPERRLAGIQSEPAQQGTRPRAPEPDHGHLRPGRGKVGPDGHRRARSPDGTKR